MLREAETKSWSESSASWGSYGLFVQSAGLLISPNDNELTLNLLLQTITLALFGIFCRRSSGTYLSAPFVFASSIYIWHSPFLLGSSLHLGPLFALNDYAVAYGGEFIYKASALVGFSISFALIGAIRAFRRLRRERMSPVSFRLKSLQNSSSLGVASKRLSLYLVGLMVLIFVLFLVKDGPVMLHEEYLDIYDRGTNTFSSVLFFRTEYFWVFAIALSVASFRDNRIARRTIAVLVIALAAVTAMFGSRSMPFICLMALLLSWDWFVRRVRILAIIAFVLVLSASSFVIATSRGSGLGANIYEAVFSEGDRLNLLAMFAETGRSIKTVLRTMDFTQQTGLVYGRTIVDSAISVVPLPLLKPLGYKPADPPSVWLVNNSPDLPLLMGLGSSLIAELYYNFGMLGSLAFFPLGYFIGKIYYRYPIRGDLYSGVLAATIAAMYSVEMRNDTLSYLRLLVYAAIIIVVLRTRDSESVRTARKSLTLELDSATPGIMTGT